MNFAPGDLKKVCIVYQQTNEIIFFAIPSKSPQASEMSPVSKNCEYVQFLHEYNCQIIVYLWINLMQWRANLFEHDQKH